jgi:hypothetical protein
MGRRKDDPAGWAGQVFSLRDMAQYAREIMQLFVFRNKSTTSALEDEMKYYMLAAISLIAGCLTSAYGNLGETEPEIAGRYGAAQETKSNPESGVITNFYIHNGFGISVKFLGGKSQSETYLKDHKAGITDPEIADLLKSNAQGSDWLSVYNAADAERWELKTKEATAVYSRTQCTFNVSTKEFLRSGNKIKIIDPAAH